MAKIQITLSAANMGSEATEADFDAWASYVNDNICGALGLDPALVEVDQATFSGRGAIGEDEITLRSPWASDDTGNNLTSQREGILSWLRVDGWEAWCASQSAAVSS